MINIDVYKKISEKFKFYIDKEKKNGLKSFSKDDLSFVYNLVKIFSLINIVTLEDMIINAKENKCLDILQYYNEEETNLKEIINDIELFLKKIDLFNKEKVNSQKFAPKNYLYFENMIININQFYKKTNNDLSSLSELIKKIRIDYKIDEFISDIILNIINSENYKLTSYNLSSLKVCSTDGKTNDDLVLFAIDFFEEKETGYENIKQICCLKEKHKYNKNFLDEQLFVIQNTFVEYYNIQKSIVEFQNILSRMKLPFSKVKNGPKEIDGLSKYDLKQRILDLNQRLELLSSTIKSTLMSVSSIYSEIRIPNFSDIFANEKSFYEFINLMTIQHSKMIEKNKLTLEKQIDDLSRNIKPEYMKLNFIDINRIINFKRTILNEEQQKKLLDDLYLIHFICETKKMMCKNENLFTDNLNFHAEEENKEKTLS